MALAGAGGRRRRAALASGSFGGGDADKRRWPAGWPPAPSGARRLQPPAQRRAPTLARTRRGAACPCEPTPPVAVARW